ncbi:unnamed protein product [Urochloa humidicola]
MAQKIAPVQELTFDVLSGSYSKFVETLRGALAGANPTMIAPPPAITTVQRPVLAKETGADKQPPRWIHVKLSGKNGAAPKVAIRSDNAYIMGFTNSQGTWFQLSKTGTTYNLVSDKPKMLGFEGHYQELVGGVNNLPNLNLNKYETSTAAGKLWDHTQKVLSDDVEDDDATINAGLTLKEAVATLCVVLCEAARFTPIYDVVNEGWDQFNKVSITLDEVEYIKNWGDLSTQLLKWKDNKYTGDADLFKKFSEMGIQNGKQALDAVQLVKLITRLNSLLAWLKYFWGLLVKKLQFQKEDTAATGYEKPTNGFSAAVNPL